ncbi:MAG: 2,3-bisphosphoglycerate-independent phosphoglycerate mutase [Erysipelotrichaceae bacterium]|nr:2,3-bisphosphoglycerate-independent phosphoglycerate mutase [Erysipelotrichaceae bacterium]
MKKVLLCILDGVGLSEEHYGNAFLNANTPCIDKLMEQYPHSKLSASGELVGLPVGQMGNSEVGHMNIGAGRIVYQPLGLINAKIQDESIYSNKVLLSIFDQVKKNDSKLHIMGLLSDGGIHSHINHFLALLEMCKRENIKRVYFHIFMDGRDTSPYSGEKYIRQLEDKIKELSLGSIATISGRYYAMDRDNNYDRVKLAYQVIVQGIGPCYDTALDAWGENQKKNITDEFIVPAVIDKEGMVEGHDGIIYVNFRPDRIRELASSLTNSKFQGFECEFLEDVKMATMMPVSEEVVSTPAFHLDDLVHTLGEYVSTKGIHQLRIAETEKYAHVTYFFDGGVEKNLENCCRKLIPSPKVATYDLKPEMSAYEITEELFHQIKSNRPGMIILNFANGDMVGHTGNYEAAICAVETLDKCLKKIVSKVDLKEYTIIITADHGNCEVMLNKDGTIHTQHTTNLVPFIVLDKNLKVRDGKLGDIAVTILDIMGLEIPKEMTGNSLIVRK